MYDIIVGIALKNESMKFRTKKLRKRLLLVDHNGNEVAYFL